MNSTGRQSGGTPSLGVVIPAFNRAHTIERAVRSALEQSRRPDRVVVVDDGSTDATIERLRQFGSQISLIEQANAGAAAARNTGVAALDTDWVAFLDSDDRWAVDHLERMAMAIGQTDGRADLYFRDAVATEFPDDVSLWSIAGFTFEGELWLVPDATEWLMMPLHPFAIQASVVRRERYCEVGGMWPELRSREDTHLFFVLGLGRSFCAVGGVGAEITADDDSGGRLTAAAGSGTAAYDFATIRLYRDVLLRFPDLQVEYRKDLDERLVDGLMSRAASAFQERDPRGVQALAHALWRNPRHAIRRSISGVRARGGP